MRPRAILCRLLVAVALVLSGVPQSQADGTLEPAGPAAQSEVAPAQGILSVPRHVLRAQLPHDDSPDIVAPRAGNEAPQHLHAAVNSPAPHLSLYTVDIRILPPVRGPPEA